MIQGIVSEIFKRLPKKKSTAGRGSIPWLVGLHLAKLSQVSITHSSTRDVDTTHSHADFLVGHAMDLGTVYRKSYCIPFNRNTRTS
jgi:hypothetical protein